MSRSLDTSSDAAAVQFALYRRMTPAEKARRVADLTESACRMALAGLRQRRPGLDDGELLLQLAILRLGAPLVARAYGDARRSMAPDRLPEPIVLALAVGAALERLHIPYVAVGSLASSVHGEPRSTDDLDFLVDLPTTTVDGLVLALGPGYYVSSDAAHAAARQPSGGTFNAIHLATAVKVDFFLAGADAFEHERLRARQRVWLVGEPAGELYVDTAEHTILRKLEWYRRGGHVSDRQWRDVVGVLGVQAGGFRTRC